MDTFIVCMQALWDRCGFLLRLGTVSIFVDKVLPMQASCVCLAYCLYLLV